MRHLPCTSILKTLFGFGSRLRSIFFVLAVSFTSSYAMADDYQYSQSQGGGPYYSSASSACAAILAKITDRGTMGSMDVWGTGAPHQFNCGAQFQKTNSDGSVTNYYGGGIIYETGSSCPAGGTYNPSNGSCSEPDNKCAILKDTAVPSFKFKSTTSWASGTISKNGCAIQLGTGICVTRTAPLYDCTFSGTITGEKLEPQDGQSTSDCSGSQCSEGEPQKEVKEDPCSVVPAGSGFTCTSTKSEDNPGKSQCGTANGAFICVDNPKPSSTASVTKTTQTSTTNPDGSTTTQTTNTTTTTACKGIANCTTGTTTNVVSGGTNANGTTKPSSSTCSGPECGGGKVNAPGTGTGDSGDGEGEEGEEDESSVSGDMACEAVVACSGDVIQCAILRQEQQTRCADKDFRDLSDKKVADAKATLESEFSGNDYKEIKPTADSTFDISNMLDTSSFLGSSCPKLPSISTSYGSQAINIDFNLEEFCRLLTILGYINVAFALKRAATIIGQGVA